MVGTGGGSAESGYPGTWCSVGTPCPPAESPRALSLILSWVVPSCTLSHSSLIASHVFHKAACIRQCQSCQPGPDLPGNASLKLCFSAHPCQSVPVVSAKFTRRYLSEPAFAS